MRLFGSLLSCVIALCLGSIAEAAPIYNTGVTPTKSNGDFIAGSGIPSSGFAVDTAVTGESIGLKARGRDTGFPLSQSGNTYVLQPGLALNGVSPWWNFDFQFSPGLTGAPATDYILTLEVDFDPSAGTDFTTISATADTWGGFTTNPGGGAWSDATPYVMAESWNLGFGFWQLLGAPPFDPNANGQYTINFSASQNNQVVASTSIIAQVGNVAPIPEPSCMALLAIMGGVCFGAWRRKRQPAAI